MITKAFCLKKNEVIDNYKTVNYCLHIGIGKAVCQNFSLKQISQKGEIKVIQLQLLPKKVIAL